MTTAFADPTIEDGNDMARGKQVRIDGKVRTIPADKVDQYEAMAARIDALFPGDRGHERQAALKAAARFLLGDLTVSGAGDDLDLARRAEQEAAAAARAVAILAIENGASEQGTAREMGVDRLTVRKWNGKVDRA
ncbi:LamD-like protein [Mycobacterium phage ZoeJ]|uniref:LamD-like protein n=1 Tax=Mycobacterium phage ZoeJ TaxID=1486427 RepID=A0A023W5E4_9CAUD|nr:HTH DNA binding protein [Mycobacterium phage ZoeJ]AHY26860.1 LamD-like protein [Mycobacterium phage ZoeJ]